MSPAVCLCETSYSHVLMSHSYSPWVIHLCHDSSIYVSSCFDHAGMDQRAVRTCDKTHSHFRHAPWLIHMCHDSSIYPRLILQDSFIHTRLICVSHMRHESSICVRTHPSACPAALTTRECTSGRCVDMWQDSFTFHICAMTHPYVSWFIHTSTTHSMYERAVWTCDKTHSHFKCAPRLIRMWHCSFIHLWQLLWTRGNVRRGRNGLRRQSFQICSVCVGGARGAVGCAVRWCTLRYVTCVRAVYIYIHAHVHVWHTQSHTRVYVNGR